MFQASASPARQRATSSASETRVSPTPLARFGRAKPLGEAYRKRMGKHFPTMVLVEVKSLLEDDAKIEIEAIALL